MQQEPKFEREETARKNQEPPKPRITVVYNEGSRDATSHTKVTYISESIARLPLKVGTPGERLSIHM